METQTNQSKSKKWLYVLLIILFLGIVAYLLVESGIFKGSLFVDSKLIAKKEDSINASIPREIAQKQTAIIINCDVLVAGAGTGGVSAAIASAREGAHTCLIEQTNWLGGMLTSAGVAAIDGRPDSTSGIFYEIIQKIEKYYISLGKLNDIHNCAVSYLCFEPNVGDFIIKSIALKEKNLYIYYNAKIDKVFRKDNKILGVGFIQDNKSYIANADVTIDATEYGDLMYLGDIDYDLGLDKNSTEPLAARADTCIQPLTYVAILQKQSTPAIIKRPDNYDRNNFKCTVKNPACPDSNSDFDMNRLLSYGRMPNDKLMINTPSHSYGNDFHATSDNLENYERENVLEEAKNYSRGLIYFIQTELGMQNYALYDEFDTEDKFAKIPYVRESRRLKGVRRLTEFDIVKGDGGQRADLEKDAIAIGDYPIDLHFCRYGVGDIFKPIAPYQIPYGVTIPEKVDGFMAADKNISVSHIVNGTTRLQPVTMATGQAVGTAAAMASMQGIEPRNIKVPELQEKLISAGSNLFFFKDLSAQHWAYKEVSKLAIKGLISGYGDFTFRPNISVNEADFLKMFRVYLKMKNQSQVFLSSLTLNDDSGSDVTRAQALNQLYLLLKSIDKVPVQSSSKAFFADLKEGTELFNQAQLLASIGIIDTKNSKFRPYDKLSRAEAIGFLGRAINIIFAD